MPTDNLPLPSLSTDGWVTDTQKKCDYLLSHFFVAEKSQSSFFQNKTTSLPYLIQAYQEDPTELGIQTEQALKSYFGAYFPSVSTEAYCTDSATIAGGLELHMFVEVTDVNGVTYNISRAAQYEDAKIVRIIEINNTGQ